MFLGCLHRSISKRAHDISILSVRIEQDKCISALSFPPFPPLRLGPGLSRMKSITDISDAVAIASGSQTIAVSVIPPRHYLRQCREVVPRDAHESLP